MNGNYIKITQEKARNFGKTRKDEDEQKRE